MFTKSLDKKKWAKINFNSPFFFSEAQSEPIDELEQGHNYPKISATEFLNSEESGFEGFIAENTFNMSEAAPIQAEIQTLEPALGTSLVEEQVEEIAVKEIHADTEVIENGAIENGIETQLMESVAPIEGKKNTRLFLHENSVKISLIIQGCSMLL